MRSRRASSRARLWGYSPDSPDEKKRARGPDIQLFAIPNAAASLYSSKTDYARFVSGIITPAPPDPSHLSPKMLTLMLQPAVKVNDEISWGLGWGLARAGKAATFWQWGNNGGYQGFVAGSRDSGRGIVVLTNSAHGLRVCREIVNAALGAEHPAFNWSQVLR
jgi:hypothetical protein